MKTLPDFSAIIFDLDGLVLDTESTYFIAWQQAAQLMGYEFSSVFCQSLSGLHYPAIEQKILADYGEDFNLTHFTALSDECWSRYVQQHGIAKKTGFDVLLNIIQEHAIPFCLATNSPESNARECLALAGLERAFSVIISRDHVKQGKPAPDIFLQAAKSLQQPIEQCLILEDSWVGIQAAHAAGAMPILIPSALPILNAAINHSTAVFIDLHEVAKIIRAKFP